MTRLTKIRMIRAVIPMIKKILTGVAIAMLVVGIGLVAFPPISNFIGTQIQTVRLTALIPVLKKLRTALLNRRSRTARLTKRATKLTGRASVPPNSPLFSRLTSTDFSMTALPTTKNLKQTKYEMLRNDTYSQAASILKITA